MIPATYHDFFSGCATVAGALIGLLFVAISVSPGRDTRGGTTDHQIRAGSAFSALINTMIVALIGLLPGQGFATTTVIVAAAGLSTTAALIIVAIRERGSTGRTRFRQLILLSGLLVLCALQLINGIGMGSGAHLDPARIRTAAGLCIAFFAFAIARAWELLGVRDVSLVGTVAGMARHPDSPADPPADPS